jgi:hypothetical protein
MLLVIYVGQQQQHNSTQASVGGGESHSTTDAKLFKVQQIQQVLQRWNIAESDKLMGLSMCASVTASDKHGVRNRKPNAISVPCREAQVCIRQGSVSG